MYNEEENIGIIYRYISPSGKSYVGYTTRPNHRKWQHKYNALSMNIKGKFYNAIRKYGWDSFKYEVFSQACKANGYTQSKIREVYLGKQLAYGKKGEDKYIWSYKKLSKKELSEILNNFE